MSSPPPTEFSFWGFMAIIGCFMGNLIGDGVMYSFGVFVPELKKNFDSGSGEVSTIISIQMGVTFGSGPVASYMTNKLGWRWTTVIGSVLASAGLCLSAVAPSVFYLYFTAGGLLGLGLGIIYLPRLDCITQYFDKWRPIVTGLTICGSGLGTFIMAPLTQLLLCSYDWKWCLVILGLLMSSNCLFALMFKPLPKSRDDESIGCEKLGDSNSETLLPTEAKKESLKETLVVMWSLMRNWAFMMFAISNFLTSLGYPIPYSFVPDNAQKLGLTDAQGSYLVSMIGISNTVARLGLGALSEVVGKRGRLFLYNTCLVICGLTMAFSNYFQPLMAAMADLECHNETLTTIVNATTSSMCVTDLEAVANVTVYSSWVCDPFYGQIFYVLSYGITSAAYVLLTTLVLADLFGAENFANSFGLLLLFQGVATFAGPPTVGYMYDAYGSYNEGFILMGVFITLSGLMLYPIPCIKNTIEKRQRHALPGSETEPSIIKNNKKLSIDFPEDNTDDLTEEKTPMV